MDLKKEWTILVFVNTNKYNHICEVQGFKKNFRQETSALGPA